MRALNSRSDYCNINEMRNRSDIAISGYIIYKSFFIWLTSSFLSIVPNRISISVSTTCSDCSATFLSSSLRWFVPSLVVTLFTSSSFFWFGSIGNLSDIFDNSSRYQSTSVRDWIFENSKQNFLNTLLFCNSSYHSLKRYEFTEHRFLNLRAILFNYL